MPGQRVGEELELNAVGVPEDQHRPESLVLHGLVVDSARREVLGPNLEVITIGHPERQVIETWSELAEASALVRLVLL